MINVHNLIEVGFTDVSQDKNGLAYRLRLPGGVMEICWYRIEDFMRFQTIRSGVTMPLVGIRTMEELNTFHHYITGHNLSNNNINCEHSEDDLTTDKEGFIHCKCGKYGEDI